MSNFAFLPDVFRSIAESAARAEGYIRGDPRAACFHARFTLEAAVHWLYRHDPSLSLPYDDSLGALLHDPSFQNLVPQAVFQKTRVIRKLGNRAVHDARPVTESEALQAVKELHHLCYWLARTYAPEVLSGDVSWQDALVPSPPSPAVITRKELEELERRLEEHNSLALKHRQERDALDGELQALRARLAEVLAAGTAGADTHDYSEAETRRSLIDVELRRAGWPLDGTRDREYRVTGMPNREGTGYADYVLWGDDGKPLGVVEAKRTTADPEKGRQQAKLYADCIEAMHGQRPVIFFTNGYETWIWDDTAYPPRRAAGFYSKDDLSRLVTRRTLRKQLDVADVQEGIAGRYYQKRAIGSIFAHFSTSRRKALLVMATGTGKTRTAVALVDAMQRAGWVKRALFLADRVALVNQAVAAFKKHLPESGPVNLVTERDGDGRVYVCTYPTMTGLIDRYGNGEGRFGPGFFDLVIIDEAHRSVYRKYGAVFRYFDSLLLGLTATPREDVDRNTYDLFELEQGVPTDAYELETAVADGFLVPPRAEQVDLKFPREGIDYNTLTDDEKVQWESLDWGDESEEGHLPERVNAGAVNNWLFNGDTADRALRYLMDHGHRVDGGDRLAKTIIFARNHEHAAFLQERFDRNYPRYAGHFARVIDNTVKYAQSLIDDFSGKDSPPHIAISVDMLDTGIDIPEAANLVFFKPVYSRIKFWQMVGRGTRLCPDLFGPGLDKEDFRIFDFCCNYDFFGLKPEGIEGRDALPLAARLFSGRARLLGRLQADPGLDPEGILRKSLGDVLYGEVRSMNRENFIVRMHLGAVDRFRERPAWESLSPSDLGTLTEEVALLPSETGEDRIESRLFDLTVLRMELALAEGDPALFEKHRRRVTEIASLLEEKAAIPAVKKRLPFLAAVQEESFWEGIGLEQVEEVRLQLRELAPFLDRKKKTVVYSEFTDEIRGVREVGDRSLPKMTGEQYEKKVKEYIRSHPDLLVIHRLRNNLPLTETDLRGLEGALREIGEEHGEQLLRGLLARKGAPSLSWFVRSLVGLDRTAAREAFSRFLSDRSLTAPQIRFVETVIDQLTARGVMEPSALYEPPFTMLDSRGPDALFSGREKVIRGIFSALDAAHLGLTGLRDTWRVAGGGTERGSGDTFASGEGAEK